MQKKVVQQKEKVKINPERVGNTFNCKYEYVVSIGGNKYLNPISGKRYRELSINTTDDLDDNDKTRY